MVGITGGSVSCQFSVDPGSSLSGMLQRFQNNHACALTHDKSVSVFIKRNGGSQRILRSAEGCQRSESRNT